MNEWPAHLFTRHDPDGATFSGVSGEAAEDAGGGYWGFTDAGLMAVSAACDPDKSKKVAEIMRLETAKRERLLRRRESRAVQQRR